MTLVTWMPRAAQVAERFVTVLFLSYGQFFFSSIDHLDATCSAGGGEVRDSIRVIGGQKHLFYAVAGRHAQHMLAV